MTDKPTWQDQERFPLDVFPYAVERMVTDTATSLCVHPDLLATALLPIVGTLIGNSRRVLTYQPPWTEPPKLWAAVIADPGGKKSPALGRLMAPLQPIEEQLAQEHAAKIEAWKKLPRDERPPAPLPIRLVVSDITTATIRDRLKSHPRGILAYRDELTGWLESLGKANFGAGGDRQQWLELWPESAVLRVDRKTDNESTIIRKAFVGLLGGIQPDKLRNIAGRDGDDGMLDRFLLTMPPFIEVEWGKPPTEKVVLDAYAELIQGLFAIPMGQINDTVEPKVIRLDPSGKQAEEEFFLAHFDQLNDLRRARNPMAGMWAKCDAHVYRIALILAELWHVCEGTPEVVDWQHFDGAARVVDYYKNQRHQLQDLLVPFEYERAGPASARKVLEYLASQKDGKTTLQALRRHGPLRNQSREDSVKLLEGLAQDHMILLSQVGKSLVVTVVPDMPALGGVRRP